MLFADEQPYEDFLADEDRRLIWSTYISSIKPNWSIMAFPFDRLPSEMRDEVYDHGLRKKEVHITSLITAKTTYHSRHSVPDGPSSGDAMDVDEALSPPDPSSLGLSAGVKYTADPNLLLASRQINKELRKRAAAWQTLILRDSDSYNFHHILLPPHVTAVPWLEFYLILFCHSCPFMTHESDETCRAAAEVGRHKSWIEDMLLQLTGLRGMVIHVHLAHSDYVPGQKCPLPCEELVGRKLEELKELRGLTELVLYRYKFEEYQNLEGPKELVERWTPEQEKKVDRPSLA